uniref:C-type lectin domain-containing protein n=1 Tax=Ascaris lumbricoides TaxID=6252 RepID=A0A9J2P0Y7_ASCLU
MAVDARPILLLIGVTNARLTRDWEQWQTSRKPEGWWESSTIAKNHTTPQWWPSVTTAPSWWQPTAGMNTKFTTAGTASSWPTAATSVPWWWQSKPTPHTPSYHTNSNEQRRTSHRWIPRTSPRPATRWPQYSAQSTRRFSTEQSDPATADTWWATTTDTTPRWFSSTGSPQHVNTAVTKRRWTSTSYTTTQRPVPTTPSQVLKERQCACDPAKLYLDIVVVVAADLATVFQWMNVSSGTDVGQFVRVGLVTFSNQAFVNGNFDDFTSYNSLVKRLFQMPYLGGSELNIESALQSASDILQSRRYYARTAILLYTSAYGLVLAGFFLCIRGTLKLDEGGFTDPKAIANQIKESGTKIITVAFRQQPEGSLVEKLSHLASPGFSFASRQSIITDEILRALCQVNCYCKNNWVQYTDNLYSPRSRYGECIRAMDVDANWVTASFACQAMAPDAHLVNELTPHKNYFVYEYASHVLPRPYKYSIGLRFDPLSGNYAWQTANNTKVPSSQSYDEWNPGYPNRSEGDCVSKIERKGWYDVGYQNIDCLREPMRYVCQMPACDTENFCSSPDN